MREESNSENKQEKPSSSIFIIGKILYTNIKITLIPHILPGAFTWILNRHFRFIVLGRKFEETALGVRPSPFYILLKVICKQYLAIPFMPLPDN